MTMRGSLTASLIAWALGALLIVWGCFVVLGYQTGIHEADELTDGHLASVAMLELAGPIDASTGRERDNAVPERADLKAHDYQRSMSVLVWDSSGNVLMRSGPAPLVPFSATEGFETLHLGAPAVAWRAFSRWDGSARSRRVMVLLNEAERDALAEDIAEQVAGPGLWLLPVVALVLGLAIHRGLRPLYALSRDVDALDIRQPLPLNGPYTQREFRAVVDSINTLAQRYRVAVSRDRELATEMAHELRTPLASLTLQARALRGASTSDEREQLLLQLERDALRAGQVLTNLLALARASRAEMVDAQQTVDLDQIARAEVAEFGQKALDSGHELALISAGPFVLTGHGVLLGLVVRNLVENALSHTPSGTQVEVQLNAQARWLQVCNTAMQTNSAVWEHTIEAGPSRALGLGSGHRVVQKIAAMHGAQFDRVTPPAGFVSCYRVTFR